MDNLEHESLEEETNSSLGPCGSNADSSNSANTWQKIFKSSENSNYGYVDSLEKAMLLLKKYEQKTTTKFRALSLTKCLDLDVRPFPPGRGLGVLLP